MLLAQYFGDATEDTFAIPLGSLPEGFVPYVRVNGEVVAFTYTAEVDETPGTVELADPPTAKAIIDIRATNEILAVKTIQASAIADPTDGALEVDGLQASSLLVGALGASAAYSKATNGAQTLLAADTDDNRAVLIVVKVTEVFADGDGGQTVFIVGETGTTNKFMANTVLDDAALGDVNVLAGINLATKDILVTGTPATGTGTGAITVTVLAIPAAA